MVPFPVFPQASAMGTTVRTRLAVTRRLNRADSGRSPADDRSAQIDSKRPPLTHQRRLLRAHLDRIDPPLCWPHIELTRANNAGLRVSHHLVPMRDPADRARHRENRREHRRRQPQCAEEVTCTATWRMAGSAPAYVR